MICVGALLARNEAGEDRYLTRVLQNARLFCQELVVVDDGSEDDTADVCRREGATVFAAEGVAPFWGQDETAPRSKLWRLACEAAGPTGWVYIFDADHEVLGITPEEWHSMLLTEIVNAWAFPLYDCWDSDTKMRTDGHWQAHLHPRPWLAKVHPQLNYIPAWETRGIHAGHLPSNYPLLPGIVPHGVGIRHLGYINARHRQEKRDRYLQLAKP